MHPESEQTSASTQIGVIGLIASGLFVFSCCSCLAVAAVYGDRMGVRTPEDLPATSRQHIEEAGLLREGEQLVIYLDNTVFIQGTDSFLVTSQRVMHHRSGSTRAIELTDVASVRSYETNDGNWEYMVESKGGDAITIHITDVDGKSRFGHGLRRALEGVGNPVEFVLPYE